MTSQNQRFSLKTLTTTVDEAMISRLLESGSQHNSHMMGIEPKATALAMGIARLFYADGDSQESF